MIKQIDPIFEMREAVCLRFTSGYCLITKAYCVFFFFNIKNNCDLMRISGVWEKKKKVLAIKQTNKKP